MNNRQKYLLKIDNPCEQNWSSMTENEQGRFCFHCSKTVIDFTKMNNHEVIEVIEKNAGKLCGRLTHDQLNKAIQINKTANNTQLYKILAGLLFIGTNESVLAKENPKLQQEIVFTVINKKTNHFTETKSEPLTDSLKNIFHGKVFDSKTKEPLSFTRIYIKDTKTGTIADQNGEFMFVIPDSLLTEKICIVIAPDGYEKTEIFIDKNNIPINKDIFVDHSKQVYLGEVIVIKKKKWWQRKNRN